MKKDLSHMRVHYAGFSLLEEQVDANPFLQFGKWFDQALESDIAEPNAMTLATVSAQCKPRARVVLLKEVDSHGFVFFTNYQSDKGRELNGNPNAALVFLWLELQRQVRVEGSVEKLDNKESDAYFHSRPVDSQLAAIASPQSTVISSRNYLEARFARIRRKHRHMQAERPAHWGGFRLLPDRFEFWQGRENRLHDRLIYQLKGSEWDIIRLAP